MLLECPACGFASSEIRFKGTVLIAEGVASLDEMGTIAAISPIRAIQTIQQGKEFEHRIFTFLCGRCGHEAHMDTWGKIHTCVLTGKPTKHSIELPDYGVLFVDANEEPQARLLFTKERFNWPSPVREEDTYV